MVQNILLGNAFSLQMLNLKENNTVSITPMEFSDVKEMLAQGFTSCIGHLDTANVVSSLIGVEVPANRINVSLEGKSTLIVAQVTGGRLPEGATTLPEGFELTFVKVSLV